MVNYLASRPTGPRRGTVILVMGFAPLAWLGFMASVRRDERCHGDRSHGSTAGMVIA